MAITDYVKATGEVKKEFERIMGEGAFEKLNDELDKVGFTKNIFKLRKCIKKIFNMIDENMEKMDVEHLSRIQTFLRGDNMLTVFRFIETDKLKGRIENAIERKQETEKIEKAIRKIKTRRIKQNRIREMLKFENSDSLVLVPQKRDKIGKDLKSGLRN